MKNADRPHILPRSSPYSVITNVPFLVFLARKELRAPTARTILSLKGISYLLKIPMQFEFNSRAAGKRNTEAGSELLCELELEPFWGSNSEAVD
jgi:hypothetical protein